MIDLVKEREAFEATRKGEFRNVTFEINNFWKEGHYKGRTSHHDDLDDAHVLSNAWFSWLERAELAKSEQKKLEAEIESLKAQLAQVKSINHSLEEINADLSKSLKLLKDGKYVLVPRNPTVEMWSELPRMLGRYMQSHDRYCPKTLKKYINRFVGETPEWLNKEVVSWESDHAFATTDLPVFIYKAMIEAQEQHNG